MGEAFWIRNVLLELHCRFRGETIVFCDNISAMYMSYNPMSHQRTKHIKINIHFVREKVARGSIRVVHIPSSLQLVDIFTKGLPTSIFTEFHSNFSMRSPLPMTVGV